jgi:hypothetical protein
MNEIETGIALACAFDLDIDNARANVTLTPGRWRIASLSRSDKLR